ncbi:hypothetical protein K3495_g7288 [Podosphaera aphanis]|nr:hypothetical protein K3495_g7288 [Podosphaera aphanis]
MNESKAELILKSGGMAFSEISDLLAFPSLYALTKEKEFSPAYELAYPQAIRPLCGPAVVVVMNIMPRISFARITTVVAGGFFFTPTELYHP